jgi:hypothetical protein
MLSRKRAVGLLVLCAASSMFGSLLVYQLFAREIPFQPLVLPSQEKEVQSAEFPRPLPPQTPLEKDPIFQELKKAFLQAPSELQAPNELKVEPTQSQPKPHSNDRWHAAENLLSAARLLESDARQQMERNEVDDCNRTLRTIQSIRAQAVELLK